LAATDNALNGPAAGSVIAHRRLLHWSRFLVDDRKGGLWRFGLVARPGLLLAGLLLAKQKPTAQRKGRHQEETAKDASGHLYQLPR